MKHSQELTAEKKLIDVYWLAIRCTKPSKFNLLVSAFAFVIALAAGASIKDSGQLLSKLQSMNETALSIAPAILGFLIAGFTIFATVTRRDLFLAMASIPYKDAGTNYLKYNIASYMVVFIHYLSFIVFCISLKILLVSDSVLRTLHATSIPKDISLQLDKCINMIVLALLAAWLVYVLMLLKTFVFNVYATVMTMIRWDIENDTANRDGA